MSIIDFILLYVSDVAASAAFWAEVLGAAPVELSPGFALFVLPNGLKLGLWLAPAVLPASSTTGGGTEVCFTVGSAAVVDDTHARYAARGWPILQVPTQLDFGYAFTAADPDGHRLRVFVPGAA